MISYIIESTNEFAILKKSSFTTSFSEILFFFYSLSFMLYVILLQDIVLNLKYTGRDITFDKKLPYNYSIVIDLISANYLYNNHKLYTDNYYN